VAERTASTATETTRHLLRRLLWLIDWCRAGTRYWLR